MKLVVFYAIAVAVFITADGRVLRNAGEVDEEQKAAIERASSLANLKYEALEQLKEREVLLGKLGVDAGSLEKFSENLLKKLKEKAKEAGLDLDGLLNQVEKLKETAKKLGFDTDAVENNGEQTPALERIEKWAEEQYKKLKEALSKLDNTGVVEDLLQKVEKKAKETYDKVGEKLKEVYKKVEDEVKSTYKKAEEKVKSTYKKAEEKVKGFFDNLWSNFKWLG